MASNSVFTQLLLLATLVVTISVISRGDEELMIQQCHNSDTPTLCLRCLRSDHKSFEANRIDLARIIILCINSHLLTLTKQVSTLGSKYQRNPNAAQALEQCSLGYARAKIGLGEADAHLGVGDYDKAAYDVSMKVVEPPVWCHNTIETLYIHVSSSFHYHMEVYLALTQALLRIIDRF